MAKKAQTKAMLFANGIGPIKRSFNRRMAGKVLNDMHAISLRDSRSFNEIKNLGISKPDIYVTSDPAILLDPSDNSYVEALMNAENVPSDKPLVGFSIRRWADSGYLDQIAKIADYCVDKFDAHPYLFQCSIPWILRFPSL